ncbi:hypothetical protein A9Q84_04480 [Halobacteriovorax marinus]|uniref:Aerobactin siderophore biosynthesis IucA/IucC N-terminal domain-containing protein n=1 Tax=Halobacteriovorax marinus TaxID=97084 RepID=A0A1Y5FEQ3_9BACT|nr:hypothetical protein A9Q84_04480 [Halobacteriovorax marinus]
MKTLKFKFFLLLCALSSLVYFSTTDHFGRLEFNNTRDISEVKTKVLKKSKIDDHVFIVEKINGSENIPESISKMLYEEQVLHVKGLWGPGAFSTPMNKAYWPESQPKFSIPYYLVPEEEADFIKTQTMSGGVLSQITEEIDGKKYHKLFVHPESYKHYKFMKPHFKFVGPAESEFMAAPTSSYRSLLLWNKKGGTKPFIAKVTLDTTIIGSISRVVKRREVLRSVANQRAFEILGRDKLQGMGSDIYPETGGLNLKLTKAYEDAPKEVGGQIIRELPDEFINGEVHWVSLAAVMSPERKGEPMVMDMIRKSGMSSKEFIDKILIDSYMDMFEKLSFEQGMNFEPHSQNLSIELKNGAPTGKWVHRDFGGMWPDIIKMVDNGKLQKAYLNFANAEDFYFLGARSNFSTSYAFFYKRQVFDMLVKEIEKNDPSLTRNEVFALNDKIDTRMKNLIGDLLGDESLGKVPTMSNYQQLGKKLQENVEFDTSKNSIKAEGKKQIEWAKKYIDLKKTNDEWVPYANILSSKDIEFRISDDGVYIVRDGKILQFGLFNEEELKVFKEHDLSFKTMNDHKARFTREALSVEVVKGEPTSAKVASLFARGKANCKSVFKSLLGF